MSTRTRLRKIALLAAPACLAVSVAGCSTDDIQFNGGIFDAVGLSDASKSSGGEPPMAARAFPVLWRCARPRGLSACTDCVPV